jgi:hypothetical protein
MLAAIGITAARDSPTTGSASVPTSGWIDHEVRRRAGRSMEAGLAAGPPIRARSVSLNHDGEAGRTWVRRWSSLALGSFRTSRRIADTMTPGQARGGYAKAVST